MSKFYIYQCIFPLHSMSWFAFKTFQEIKQYNRALCYIELSFPVKLSAGTDNCHFIHKVWQPLFSLSLYGSFHFSSLGLFSHSVAMPICVCVCLYAPSRAVFTELAQTVNSVQQSRCPCVSMSVCTSLIFFKASHQPSDHMLRSWPLIGLSELCFLNENSEEVHNLHSISNRVFLLFFLHNSHGNKEIPECGNLVRPN